MSRGTRNGEISFSEVLAKTVKKSATGAEVIQVFWPEMTQSSPSRVARVAIAERSLPAPGSVKQIVPTRSPRKRRAEELVADLLVAGAVEEVGAHQRLHGAGRRDGERAAGQLLDRQAVGHDVLPGAARPPPGSASRRSRGRPPRGTPRAGTRPRASISPARGTIFSSTSRRKASWIACCSSVSAKSITPLRRSSSRRQSVRLRAASGEMIPSRTSSRTFSRGRSRGSP